MRSSLIELSAIALPFAQPLNRLAHWVTQRAGNDDSVSQPGEVDISQLKLLVRPRLGKVRKLSTAASNCDRLGPLPQQAALQLASNNLVGRTALAGAKPASARRPALRVVVKPDATGTGRLVISGRMADVCAELDRLDRLDRLMQPCA